MKKRIEITDLRRLLAKEMVKLAEDNEKEKVLERRLMRIGAVLSIYKTLDFD